MTTLATLYNDVRSLILQFAQEKLISGTNIKTVNNESLLGSGNISISGSGADYRLYLNDDGKLYLIDDVIDSFTLSASPTSISMFDISTVTATVLDTDNAGIEGIKVTFKVPNELTVGGYDLIDKYTNSSGVATTTVDGGSFFDEGDYVVTATCEEFEENVTITVSW